MSCLFDSSLLFLDLYILGYGFEAFERCAALWDIALGVVSWIQFIAAWVHYITFGVLSLVLSWDILI